jgi:hypothetical protein
MGGTGGIRRDEDLTTSRLSGVMTSNAGMTIMAMTRAGRAQR